MRVGPEDVRGDRAESFAQKTGIAADDDFRAGRFFRDDVARNAGHSAADIGKSKLLRNDGAPSRGSKFDLSGHMFVSDRLCYSLGDLNARFYMTDKRIVLTTAGSIEEAQRIAAALVEQRLAACVNILPGVESVFRWQGKIDRTSEWLMIIKTKAEAFERVRDAIQKLHSYDVPEIISLEIDDGSAAYLQWIDESVS